MKKNYSCQKYLDDFVNSKIQNDYSFTKEENCLDPFLKNKDISKVSDPIPHAENNEYCKLISNKIHGKYIYTYDPSIFLNTFITNNDYTKHIHDVIDTNVYTQCCNCISIVLYALNSLTKYIYSIYFSVKNAEKYLPNWVVRLYIDVSVYEFLSGKQNTHEYSVFSKITNSPNVEIYTYICPTLLISHYDNINDYTNNLHKTRFVRFLTFIDPSVKTAIVREADGIISVSDCNNIKIFEQSNKIFYFAPFNTGRVLSSSFQNTKESYSDWLNIYKSYIDKDFFESHTNVYDLLAGLISINIKIKKSVFDENILVAQHEIDNFIKNIDINKFISEKNYRLINRIHNIRNILSIGFDEIFLLRLFKNIISCKINVSTDVFYYNTVCEKLITDTTLGYHNIYNNIIYAKIFEIKSIYRKNKIMQFHNFDDFMSSVKNGKIVTKINIDDLLSSIESIFKKITPSKEKQLIIYYLNNLLNNIAINDLDISLSVIIDFYISYLNQNKPINYNVYLLIYPHNNFEIVNNNYSINFGNMLNNPVDTEQLFYIIEDIYAILNHILNPINNNINYKRKIAKYQHKIALLSK